MEGGLFELSPEGGIMRKLRLRSFVLLLSVLAIVGAACASDEDPGGGGDSGSVAGTGSTGATGAPETLLDRILAEGQIRVSTDPAYPPQSSYDEASGTWEGFDIDVAQEISTRLGLTEQVDWQTPSWDVITAGNWNDRWDVSVGSMTVTADRAEVLDFSSPYYYTPAGLAVQQGSSITSIDQLSGKTIGVCGACTYEFYLDRTLEITGYDITFLVPEDVTIKTYDTDSTAIQDLAIGRLDAAMSAVPTLQGAIDKGKAIELLGDPVFYEPLAVAIDKNAPLDDASLVAKISEIIDEMHADGTLTELSMKWYGEDLTVNPVG
jgi:polar amino acid transport system substrate-binding protein